MEENQTVVEEIMEDIEESSAETIPNDSLPPATENSEESGEDTVIDNPQDKIDVSESIEESAAVPEQTDTASDSMEELEEIDGELTLEEYVSGNEISEQIVMYQMESEESVLFLEKPINEYSASEGLLLLIFILGLVAFIYHVVFD